MRPTSACILALGIALATACATDEPAGTDLAEAETRVGEGDTLVITLEGRSGTSTLGWSFAAGGLVPAEDADLVLSSFDCGARGRWVRLEAVDGLVCTAESVEDGANPCSMGLEIGGSDPAVELGAVVTFVEPNGEEIDLVLVDRTPTPFEWYEAQDLSYEVVLEVFSLDAG